MRGLLPGCPVQTGQIFVFFVFASWFEQLQNSFSFVSKYPWISRPIFVMFDLGKGDLYGF